jgi:hypothetical protein
MDILKFSNFHKSEKINESTELDYQGVKAEEVSIEDHLPGYYAENKEKVDAGKIKYFYDGGLTECGCLIDLDTMEVHIIDSRG